MTRRWLLEDDRFGVVYQDARPGDQSGYSRIGWHSDHQSGPNLDVWPSVAFTIHLDADVAPERLPAGRCPARTSAAPTTCRSGSSTCPARSAVYCERGDVLLHHSDLWHSAARATDDGEGAIRRHVRGGWYGGARLAPNHGLDDFVKNAAPLSPACRRVDQPRGSLYLASMTFSMAAMIEYTTIE